MAVFGTPYIEHLCTFWPNSLFQGLENRLHNSILYFQYRARTLVFQSYPAEVQALSRLTSQSDYCHVSKLVSRFTTCFSLTFATNRNQEIICFVRSWAQLQ